MAVYRQSVSVHGQFGGSCTVPLNDKEELTIVTATTRLFIGLGANLTPAGFTTPQAGCEAALKMLGTLGVKIVKTSHWYESAPVPPSDQPWYLNAVAEGVTASDAAKTLAVLHQIEAHFGRQRSTRNAARVLDLDLLDFGGQIHHHSHLTLPHPRLHERAFVLLPLRDLVDDWTHPETGAPLDALITQLPAGQLIRRAA
jgi:2-amino-4-hydroxy-6-hydroxymethyldihydropteridine diphosphokinase